MARRTKAQKELELAGLKVGDVARHTRCQWIAGAGQQLISEKVRITGVGEAVAVVRLPRCAEFLVRPDSLWPLEDERPEPKPASGG